MRVEPAADVVVVGGGSAGCVVAARLSEDSATRVVLLEAGPPDRDPWIALPAGYARLFGTGRYNPGFATEPEPELHGRSIPWPRGRVLGGSGSVNGLVFLRGSPVDYAGWVQSGARGWGWDDVLPAFRRLESWRGAPDPSRGQDGPIRVTEPRRLAPSAQAFVESAVAAGLPRNRDMNAGAIEGAAGVQLNVDGRLRSSSARTYLRPAMRRPNLSVRTLCPALRIVVEDGRATGVVTRDPSGEEVLHPATRTVVLSAGAIETPKLLMLSGIGDGAALQGLGIPVLRHSPDVGRNLQDHLIARCIYRVKPCGTLNEILGSRLRMARMGLDWLIRSQGPLSIGAGEATAFARITPGAEEAEAQLLFVNFSTFDYSKGLHDFPGIMINYNTCRPLSRGELTLRSADPAEKPVIRANYLSDPYDLRVMLGAAKLARRIAATGPLAALVEEELRPGPQAQSDEAIMENIRATAGTVFHPCGTARMGSDDRAVLDPRLRVRGIEGLRVADASVFPLIPSPNIQPAALMVGERCAEFLAEDARVARAA